MLLLLLLLAPSVRSETSSAICDVMNPILDPINTAGSAVGLQCACTPGCTQAALGGESDCTLSTPTVALPGGGLPQVKLSVKSDVLPCGDPAKLGVKATVTLPGAMPQVVVDAIIEAANAPDLQYSEADGELL